MTQSDRCETCGGLHKEMVDTDVLLCRILVNMEQTVKKLDELIELDKELLT